MNRRFPAVLAASLWIASAQAATAAEPATVALQARIESLLRETPLVDGHNDLVVHYHACDDGCPRGLDGYPLAAGASGHTDIARWRKGMLGAQLLNAGWTDNDTPTLEGTLRGLAFVRDLVSRHPADLALVRSGSQLRGTHAAGRIAVLLALEHPGRLGEDEATVRRLASEGLRANILAYDGPSALADGHAGPAKHQGLSPLGRDMVGWMQGHGILVDLSHASRETMHDVLDIARAPVIFSHSNAAALADVPRNVPDDVLRRLPENGGIVMVAFVPYFASKAFAEWMERGDLHWQQLLQRHDGDRERAGPAMAQWERDNPAPEVGVSDIADHVEHVRDVAGIDHVGIGADFDGISFTVTGLEDVSTYPRLLGELMRRGWSDADLGKLAGANFLRVLDHADAAAAGATGSAPIPPRTR